MTDMETDASESVAWSIVDSQDHPNYSEQDVVSELTSFYEFLISMYLPREKLKHPPEGGWDIKRDGIYPPINDTVYSLLKVIPYLQTDDVVYGATVIWCRTSPVDYSTDEFKRAEAMEADVMSEYSLCPPHVIQLTRWVEGYGMVAYLDTERGTISWVDYESGASEESQYGFANYRQDAADFPVSEWDGEQTTQNWREYPTYSVRDFFELLKIELRTLAQTPINHENIFVGTNPKADDLLGQLIITAQEIYRKCGWPSDTYNKEKCTTEIGKLWKDYKDGSWQRMEDRDRRQSAEERLLRLTLEQGEQTSQSG